MGAKNLIFFLLTILFPFFLLSQVDTAWIRRYNGPSNYDDFATAIAVDNLGNVYVTGYAWCGYRTYYDDFLTIKYDANGNELWSRRYHGPRESYDQAYAIAVDINYNVYVAGGRNEWPNFYNSTYVTIKYDADGNQLWERRYNGPGNDANYICDIALDQNNNVYVTGESDNLPPQYQVDLDYATIKYSSDGTQLWVRRYNGPADSNDIPNGIVVDNLGNVYVTGKSLGLDFSFDYATVKYSTDGEELWVRRYNGPGNGEDVARAIIVDNFGYIYVTGWSWDSSTNYDFVTIKYSPDGEELWVRRYNSPGNGEDKAYAIAIDNFGNVYVTGFGYDSITSYDYITIKYSPNGEELWVRRYNGPANSYDFATALAIDNLNNIYVTGRSYGLGTDLDYMTIKYSSPGEELWVIRYNGPANSTDILNAIAVDNLSNVYITGGSLGQGTAYDYCTIKYIQTGGMKEEKIIKIIKDRSIEKENLYDATGRIVKGRKLKRGIYFRLTKEEIKKRLILK